jgi:integral membrane sensor domain MASE1
MVDATGDDFTLFIVKVTLTFIGLPLPYVFVAIGLWVIDTPRMRKFIR